MIIPMLTRNISGVKLPVTGCSEEEAVGENTVGESAGVAVICSAVGEGRGVVRVVGALVTILVGRGVIGVGVGETLSWADT